MELDGLSKELWEAGKYVIGAVVLWLWRRVSKAAKRLKTVMNTSASAPAVDTALAKMDARIAALETPTAPAPVLPEALPSVAHPKDSTDGSSRSGG